MKYSFLLIVFISIHVFAQEKEIAKANNSFSLKISNQFSSKPDYIFSPLSLSTALGMMYLAAGGETKAQMKQMLSLPNNDELTHKGFSALTKILNDSNSIAKVNVANKIWYDDSRIQMNPNFLNDNLRYYNAIPIKLDFLNRKASAEAINSWASEMTEKKIEEIIKEGMISGDLVTIVTNAVYFNGKWKDDFDEGASYEGDFYNQNEQKSTTKFMRNKGNYFVREFDEYMDIFIPYKGYEYLFHLIVPKNNLASAEKQLQNQDFDAKIGMDRTIIPLDLDLHFPKFKLETKSADENLNDCLIQLGMKNAFNSVADFKKMGTSSGNISIDFIQHKAIIEVSEKGTVAAAVTAIGAVSRGAPPEYKKIVVDHPFLFVITHRDTGAILFQGKVSNPSFD